jgi:hypothetical protein
MKSFLFILLGLAPFSASAGAQQAPFLESKAAPDEIIMDSRSSPRDPEHGSPEAFRAPVSRQQAARIARQAIERQTGARARVTGISREDDHGATWEVEVTLRGGREEFDVYVGSAGRIVKILQDAGRG